MKRSGFCLWSGGLKSLLAFRAAREEGLDTRLLITFFHPVTRMSIDHHLPLGLMRDHARLVGVHLQEIFATPEDLLDRLREVCRSLVPQGIDHGVFGDVRNLERRAQIEGLCRETGVTPRFPLWEISDQELKRRQNDIECLIVSVDAAISDEGVLGSAGRDKLPMMTGGPDAEARGSIHTLVVAAPELNGRLHIGRWKKGGRGSRRYLDITEWATLPATHPHGTEVTI